MRSMRGELLLAASLASTTRSSRQPRGTATSWRHWIVAGALQGKRGLKRRLSTAVVTRIGACDADAGQQTAVQCGIVSVPRHLRVCSKIINGIGVVAQIEVELPALQRHCAEPVMVAEIRKSLGALSVKLSAAAALRDATRCMRPSWIRRLGSGFRNPQERRPCRRAFSAKAIPPEPRPWDVAASGCEQFSEFVHSNFDMQG